MDTKKKPVVDVDKAKKFRDLGAKRAQKVVKAMRNMAKLGNTHSYTYTPVQIEVLFEKYFTPEFKKMREAFNPNAIGSKEEVKIEL